MTQINKIIEFTLRYIGEKDETMIALHSKEIAEAFKNSLQNKTEKEVESWLHQWIALFPPDITTGGIPLQSSFDSCFTKMVNFIKRTKHNRDIIFAATEAYLEERGLNNFAYTKAAQYFIDKRGEGSLLESWCDKILNQEDEEVSEGDYTENTSFI